MWINNEVSYLYYLLFSTGASVSSGISSGVHPLSQAHISHFGHHYGQPSIDASAHVLTPTDQIEDPMLDAGRRSSSGALLSPEVMDQIRSAEGDSGSMDDNFYLLKKDSQRRLTLVKVLQHDRVVICSQWHQLLMKEVADTCLTLVNFA